jgi:predicted nucleic acid-binding Zn ribbon protein
MGKVDEVLGGLLRSLGIHEEVARQGVLDRWADVVGERIAEVTRARSVSRGILFVEVRSSAWITELNLMRHELMTRLNAGAGDGRVERIVFTQAEDAGRDFGRESGRDEDDQEDGSGPP